MTEICSTANVAENEAAVALLPTLLIVQTGLTPQEDGLAHETKVVWVAGVAVKVIEPSYGTSVEHAAVDSEVQPTAAATGPVVPTLPRPVIVIGTRTDSRLNSAVTVRLPVGVIVQVSGWFLQGPKASHCLNLYLGVLAAAVSE